MKEGNNFHTWICHECPGEPEFDHPAMMEHMRQVHGIDTKTAKGTRRMKMHLDGATWYQSNFEVVVNGMKFTEFVRNERSKGDPLRFEKPGG